MNESNYQFRGTDDYIISDDLMLTANIAIRMNKPLLVKGEPGTGKTALAESIAKALGRKLIVWSIKSTTKAQDGLYQYDVVRRLYDSELGNEGVDDVSRYIKWVRSVRRFALMSSASFLSTRSTKRTWNSPTTFYGSWTAWNFISRKPTRP